MPKINRFFVVVTFIAVLIPFLSCQKQEKTEADLVLLDGNVITVDPDFSIQEAVAVKENKILAVGTISSIKKFISPKTQVIDLDQNTVLPGLIDAHAHMNSMGEELTYFNIRDCRSFEEIVERVQKEVRNRQQGEWIIGGRWDHTQWETKEFPVHDSLSAVSPNNPVYLSRVDGNSALVNKKTLELAGIDKNTPNPEGGVIIKKQSGEPTGVLLNRAMNLVKAHFPPETDESWKQKILQAVDDCIKKGLTGWHEAGVSVREIRLYKELIDQNRLKMRVYAMLGDQEIPVIDQDLYSFFKNNWVENYGDHFLEVKSIKLFFDGALGSRGAAFFQDYADDPGNKGLLRITPDYIVRVCQAALKADMGVNTHCIGIRGNRLCLESYIKALKENPTPDHRFRIEHAQIVRKQDIELFSEHRILPSMQPTHCTSDMTFIEERIGKERCRYAYAWRSFLAAGLAIPCGSDFPVESNNPFYGIYAAITRQDHDQNPEDGWHPEQKMIREEAVKGFTLWAAYAAFQENRLGSIEKGKYADFTVIDRDILTVEPKQILDTQVLFTIVDGEIQFQAKPTQPASKKGAKE